MGRSGIFRNRLKKGNKWIVFVKEFIEIVRRWRGIYDLKDMDFLYKRRKGIQLWEIQIQNQS